MQVLQQCPLDVSQIRCVLCCAIQLVSIIYVSNAWKRSDLQVMMMMIMTIMIMPMLMIMVMIMILITIMIAIMIMMTIVITLIAWTCNYSQVMMLLFKGCKQDSHDLHSVIFLEHLGHLLLHQMLISGLGLLSQLDPACRLRGHES